MRVLVTGVAGFIGSVTSQMLVQQRYEVVGIDNLSSGSKQNIPPEVKFFQGDIADLNIHEELGKIDACLHFAGRIEAGASMKVPARFLVENAAKTQILLEALLKKGCSKFVFSSSAAVYGDGVSASFTEGDPLNPSSVYGYSKLSIEQSLRWLGELSGLRYASLRYFNAAGAAHNIAESHVPETHLIPLLLDAVREGGASVSIFGNDYPTPDGTCIRDYVHVADLARAHVLALQYLDREKEIVVNLGSGTGHSVLEVINTIERVTNRNVSYHFVGRREGDPPSLIANITLAQRLLGWAPSHSQLDRIVLDAWKSREQARPT